MRTTRHRALKTNTVSPADLIDLMYPRVETKLKEQETSTQNNQIEILEEYQHEKEYQLVFIFHFFKNILSLARCSRPTIIS